MHSENHSENTQEEIIKIESDFKVSIEGHHYLTVDRMRGSDLNDLVVLIYVSKWNDFQDDESVTSYLIHVHNNKAKLILQQEGRLKDFCITTAGDLYIVGKVKEEKGLYRTNITTKARGTYSFEKIITDDSLAYIWNLNENFIFCWGEGVNGYVSQGKEWFKTHLSSPILSVHGTHANNIVARTNEGIVFWKNNRWELLFRKDLGTSYHDQYIRVIKDRIFIASFPCEYIELWERGYVHIDHQADYSYFFMKWDPQNPLPHTELQQWDLKQVKWPEGLEIQNENIKKCIPRLKPFSLYLGKTILWIDPSGINQTQDFNHYQKIDAQSLEKIFHAEFWTL